MILNDNDNDISYVDVVTDDLVDGFDLIGENWSRSTQLTDNQLTDHQLTDDQLAEN